MTSEPVRESYQIEEALWTRGRNLILVMAVLGWAASVYGFAADPSQFHASYLVAYVFYLSIGWGAMFFVMVQHVTSAAWSVTVRRLMENMMIVVAPMALLFLPIAFGLGTLYEWGSPGYFDPHDPQLRFKAVFFSQPFFLSRTTIYFLVWTVLGVALYKNSVAQDEGGDVRAYQNTRWWSAPGLLALTVTVTMACVDWVMSLDPHWYSTIFGIYVFSGGALAMFAAVTKVALTLRSQGVLTKSINVEHYHDLGKWMFALTVWWAYIAFSQYMLIWYADIPEETVFFRHRMENSWAWVSALLLVGRFAVPFIVLLSRGAKRNLGVLYGAAIWILLMHFVDLHWLIMPSVHPHGFHLHWMDLATLLAVGSFFGLVFWYRLRSAPMVPAGDLRLEEALAHHNT